MLKPRFVVWMFSIVIMALGANVVLGQGYPNKPIRMVLAEVGGGLDVAARLIVPGLSGSLGQQVIVDNRGGASGTIAIQIAAKAQPDGYTVLFYGPGLWLLPFMQGNVPWDPVRDFAPIALTTSSPSILVVNPSVPAKSVKELIALAKSKPGELNYGGGAAGTSGHLAAELFKSMAGVNIVRIPYKGSGPALIGLIAGEVQVMFPIAAAVTPHVKSGKLRALAVASAQPSALAPGLPTVMASGLPGYESVSITGVFAPAKTPTAIINRLNQEVVGVLKREDIRERLLDAGVEAAPSSPEQLAATMKSEMTRLGKVIKDAGVRAE